MGQRRWDVEDEISGVKGRIVAGIRTITLGQPSSEESQKTKTIAKLAKKCGETANSLL